MIDCYIKKKIFTDLIFIVLSLIDIFAVSQILFLLLFFCVLK